MLNIQHFSKSYSPEKKAVDDLSLEVNAGDIFGFIGHNGAGKTTTLKAVVGILEFEEGDITLDGLSIRTQPVECKRHMAYISDNPYLYEGFTGIKFLNFVADIYEVSAADREARIKQYADAFELTQNLGDAISSYSHGMKQKLVIISALVHAPRLLVLDEPFVGLDPKASFTLKEIMRDITASGGAIFFSTHVLEVAQSLCTRIAIIQGGKLVAHGKTEDVVGQSSLEDVFLELIEK